jgi:RND family efflux transporter MFP subunit
MKIFYQVAVLMVISTALACNAGSKEKKADLNDKRVELENLKSQQAKLTDQIMKLEEEIAKIDPNAVPVKPKLVSVTTLTPQTFAHYIDLQGRVDAENIAVVTPRGMGGQVRAVYVKEGDHVKKGQLLLKLDDAVARQQIEQVKVQLELARSVYQRRKNLWDQKIGTEVELITAKSNVDNLEKQIDLLKEQLDMSNVYAEISGVADQVNIKVGELFTAQSAASGSGILIVNSSNLKAVVDVPENYLARVRKGTAVIIEIPDLNKTFNSTISLISQQINPNSRGFAAEAKIPSAQYVKPNQVAIMRIQDYAASNTIVIPLNTLQTDEQGKYVYILTEEKGKKVARKKQVQVGEMYGDQIEVKNGLASGDQLISQGFQSVYDGQPITTEVK